MKIDEFVANILGAEGKRFIFLRRFGQYYENSLLCPGTEKFASGSNMELKARLMEGQKFSYFHRGVAKFSVSKSVRGPNSSLLSTIVMSKQL